jgi:hypothetical protein
LRPSAAARLVKKAGASAEAAAAVRKERRFMWVPSRATIL